MARVPPIIGGIAPDLQTNDFKKMIFDDNHWQNAPAWVNEDIAMVLNSVPTIRDDLGESESCAFRLCTWDGAMLSDYLSLGSQLDQLDDKSLFKMIWYKQKDTMSDDELLMVHEFAQSTERPDPNERTRGLIVVQPAGTEFVVYPMWGTGDRCKHILGVFYQHMNTENHCKLMSKGVHPMMVDQSFPVQIVDFDVTKLKAD